MKLYEVNQQLEELLAKLEPDAETGEILADDDSIFAEIDALQMERKSILEYLAKLVLNYRAEESALKEEEKRLAERRKRIEKKEDRLLSIDGYVDIDSEQMNCFKGTVLKNDKVSGTGFPILEPGSNTFVMTGGVTSLAVTPRWCTL